MSPCPKIYWKKCRNLRTGGTAQTTRTSGSWRWHCIISCTVPTRKSTELYRCFIIQRGRIRRIRRQMAIEVRDDSKPLIFRQMAKMVQGDGFESGNRQGCFLGYFFDHLFHANTPRSKIAITKKMITQRDPACQQEISKK